MAEGELVRLAIDGPVAEIRFNRPEALNALDIAMARAFAAAVAAATGDAAVRAILLTAEGRAFVAGGDVAAMAADPAAAPGLIGALIDTLIPAILALRAGDAPVVAAVRGVAAGAGLALVAGADLAIADEGARFVMAYDAIGGVPDCGASWFLPQRIGRGLTTQMMLLGRTLTAAEALAAGLVAETCTAEEVEPRARALAARLAQGPTGAFGHFRRLIDAAPQRSLAEHMAAERDAFVAAASGHDLGEGAAAFVARRRPAFTGR
ncbi:MAG: enoyl-CoA hydratase-related protein [Gemmobacter sp.]